MAIGILDPSVVCGGGVGSPATQQNSEQQLEYKPIKVDGITELLGLLGQDTANLDLPKESVKYMGEYPFIIYYEAPFLGKAAQEVKVFIRNDYYKKLNTINSISICIYEKNFPQCKAYLEEAIGECYESGSLPYAASNGGAVTYFTYYKNGYRYYLSMASARNYYTLEITQGKPQGAPRHQSNAIVMFPGLLMNQKPNPTGAVKPAVNNGESWTCSSCGTAGNKGKFCVECGSPR